MAKQLNVSLNIDANTQKAKQSLNELNKILTNIQTSRTITINDTSLQEAKQAAADLKFHLAQATSVDTGKLNLGAFSQSLKKAGQDLNSLYSKLSSVGPEGQKAFLALSQSIVQADHASLTLGNRLSAIGTALANTARWQISSSLLHGFIRALSGAYNYAQDLNKSLNNIRIVTGKSIEDMAAFADEANRAARALSVSTTAYTDAALIYYQQGIRDQKEIAGRVETTVKLANVSRQSAEEVSNQMTAIWNNFYDGSESLEHYADVITALGAATASSSQEISTGLEKFAAVAETVGLSYEYATSALATITATTRQSADIVGTALKTLFARIQDLELGETLEDGTTLGKYSKALEVVGVNIKDINGEVKNMDTILDELGAKWNTIAKDQQIALAQTVAGTRQYTQLMALMSNWDFMKENLEVAKNSEGTLQEQADIYAEGWEAASKRVKTSIQSITQQLLDDNFFIKALNGIESFINTISQAIKGLGGLKTILLAIGTIVTQKYAAEMPRILQNLAGNFSVLTGAAEKQRLAMIESANSIIQNDIMAESGNKAFLAQISAMKITSAMTTELEQKKKSLSTTEQDFYQQKIKEVELHGQVAASIGEEIDALEQQEALLTAKINGELYSKGMLRTSDEYIYDTEQLKKYQDELQKLESQKQKLLEKKILSPEDLKQATQLNIQIDAVYQKIDGLKQTKTGAQLVQDFKQIAQQVGNMNVVLTQARQKTESWYSLLDSKKPDAIKLVNNEIKEYIAKMKEAGINTAELEQLIQNGNIEAVITKIKDQSSDLWGQLYQGQNQVQTLVQIFRELRIDPTTIEQLRQILEKLGILTPELNAALDEMKGKFQGLNSGATAFSTGLTRISSLAMSVSMALNAIKNLGNIWSNEDASTGEKIIQTLTAMGMLLPAINSLLSEQNIRWMKNTGQMALNALTKKAATTATAENTGAEAASIPVKYASGTAGWAALGPMLMFVAIAAAVVAAIVGIIALIKKLSDAYNADAIAAEKAKKAATEISEQWKEAKDRAEELRSTFDNYNTVIDKLNECTKGTKEWRDALQEVNQTVLDILQEHPELASQLNIVRDTETGQLSITNAEEIFTKAEAQASALQIASINANAAAHNAGLRADATALYRNFQKTYNGYNTAEAEAQNSQIYKITNDIANKNFAQYLDQSGLFKTEAEFKQLTGTLGMTDERFHEFYTSISNLAKSATGVASELDNAAQLAVGQELEDKYNFLAANGDQNLNGQIKEAIINNQTEAYKTAQQNIYDAVMRVSDSYKKGQKKADLETDQNGIWLRYLKAIGQDATTTAYRLDKNAIRGTVSNRTYTFNNGEKDVTLTAEAMARTIAASEAMAAIGESAQKLAAEFANMSAEGQEFTANVLNSKDTQGNYHIDNQLGNYTKAQLSIIKDASGVDGLAAALGLEPEALSALAEALGTDIDSLQQQIIADATTLYEGFDDIGNNLTGAVKEAFSDFANDDTLTSNGKRAIAAAFKSIFSSGGEEALNAAQDFVKQFQDQGLSDEVAEIFQNTDWSDWDIDKGLKEAFEKADIPLPDGFDAFIDKMRDVNHAVKSLDVTKFEDKFKKLQKIIDGIKIGDTISPEDYAELGEGFESYFQLMADGTYKLIKSANEFVNIIKLSQQQELYDSIYSNKGRIDYVRGLEKSLNGYSASSLNQSMNSVDANGNYTYNKSGVEAQLSFLKALNYDTSEWENAFAASIDGTVSKEMVDAIGEAMHSAVQKYEGYLNETTELQTDSLSKVQALFSTSSSVGELQTMFGNMAFTSGVNGKDLLNAYDKQLTGLAMSAGSLDELQHIQNAGTKDWGSYGTAALDSYEYSQALLNLAEQFDNTRDECEKYNQALLTGDKAQIEAAQDALELSIRTGELANKYNLDAASIENYSKRIAKSFEEQGMSQKAAAKLGIAVAAANQRLDRGLKNLNSNLSDYKTKLTAANKGSAEWSSTMDDLKTDLADVLNIDSSILTDTFAETTLNSEDLQKALDGDIDAIQRLQTVASDEMMKSISDGLSGASLDEFNSAWDYLKENMAKGISAGNVDQSELLDSFNAMIAAGKMTKEQIEGALAGLHVSANIKTTYNEQPVTVPTTITEQSRYIVGYDDIEDTEGGTRRVARWRTETNTFEGEPREVMGYVPTYEIEGTTGPGGETTAFASAPKVSGSSTSSSKGGGGGGSKSSAAQHKHSVNRYSNEENLVKGISDDYDRLSTAKDHAFGADKLNRMEKELRTLRELKDATTAYLGAIVGDENADKFAKAVYEGKNIGQMIAAGELGGTLAADYASLFSGKDASGKNLEYQIKDAAGNAKMMEEEFNLGAMNSLLGGNLAVQLDAFGRIYNRDALLDELDRLYNNEEDRWQEISASASEADENEHTRRQAMIEAFRERLDQYEETRDLSMDKVNEWLDYIYQIQQVNADKIAYKLEVQTKLMDNELTAIQNAVKVLGNTIYRDVDAMRNWYDKNITQRGATRAANAAVAEQTMADAWEKWQAWTENELDDTAINSEQALELFDQARDAIQGAFDDIFDRISEMESLFGDTLDYWNEKIERVTSAIEANANTLDHLQNVLGLLGRGTDYRALGTILKGQLDNARGGYDAAAARAASSTDAYNDALAFYATLHGEEAEFYKANVLDKMEDQMRADVAAKEAALENVLEKVNAWFENEVNRIYQESEDRLTGNWGSFDALDAAMQRQHNLADEYLTKTNQLYETNDLLRKLSQDLDKTDSVAAKAKIKAFSDEIELMKQQEKLSKTDLEIAKARYEVLLAQIALEEAQNAKSVVRLQRDNEGNYGYVYTADQDKIADAEKNLADKQNDLYNLVLNQTQDYTEKILQHTRERNEALKELDMQGITDQEEYNKQRQDIIEKYNALIEADYQSYYTAVKWLNQVGAEGQTEAWTNSFTDILYSQDEFGTALAEETEAITQEVNEDMDWLNEQREFYTEEAKVGNEELKDSVKKITNATDDLVHKLTDSDGLIKGMSNATKTADELNRKFSEQYGILMNAARGYETLLGQIDSYYTTVAGYEKDLGESDHTGVTEANNGGTGASGGEPEAQDQNVSSGSGGSFARIREIYDLINSGAVGNGWQQRKEKLMAKGYSEVEFEAGKRALELVYMSGYTISDAINQALREYAGQFDTGGYTGDWGPGGKLAFLHEKELVLNKEDTKNLLDAVNIIREISSAIDLRTAAAYRANGLNSPYYEAGVQQIEQTVTIHAEFPNVEDHNEIEEAFNNLINRASQFANRQ